MESEVKPHVAFLSSPGLGHLIPIIELAKHFSLHFNFKVTIIAVTSQTSQAESNVLKSATSSSTSSFHIIQIPSPDVSALLQNDAEVVACLGLIMREARAAIRSTLEDLTPRPDVFIVDLFGSESLPIARDLNNNSNILTFIYIASNAWFFASLLYTPVWDNQIQGQFVDQNQPLKIPGCTPVRPDDVVDPMLDRTTQQYREHLVLSLGMVKSHGILINTWEELEPKTLESLRHENLLGGILRVPVYAIGPLVRPAESTTTTLDRELLTWLDEQPKESVVYVSFGSGGTLSYEQTIEVAYGLEISRLRFVWVVRAPSVGSTASAFFNTGNNDDDVAYYLPDGFLSRNKEVGRVVPEWGPQVRILGHASVGGFLSHCGWSSTLESITNGVAMVAWPLYAEQRMNATMLTEEAGVAVRPRVLPTKKVVEREEIARLLREIMEQEEGKKNKVRERVKELKESATKASEEGGSSYLALAQLLKHCRLKHVV